jgi:hypothetical protein
MQIKTIKKNIESKLNDWLDSIKDDRLRRSLKSNILVSGGSITSMLLSEPVNDYDVYIKDRDVLFSLCEYYTKDFPGITILKGWEKEPLVADIEKNYDTTIENIHNAYAIAVRNLKPEQVKLYFDSEKGGMQVNEDKTESELLYEPTFFSPNAISLSNQLQIVVRFHGDNEAIHKTFDFIHATNYFTFDSGLVTNKEALECILTKQLRYQGSLYPLTSIIRMKKFIKRGWNINAGEILKIMFQISELNLTDPDVLEEQLIGVDVAYFAKLIEILRGVNNEKISSAYLNTIIDKVFNDTDDTD